MNNVKKIPEEYHTITPSLVVKDGLKAIKYYKKVFGAINKGTMMMPDNKAVAHAELQIGNSKISIQDPFGHIWSISTHIKDLTEEETKKAASEAFSKMSK